MKTPVMFAVLLICGSVATVRSSSQGQPDTETFSSAEYAKQLSSIDPVNRQSAAEGLARLVAIDQRKLVDGYLREEKDKRVRLALNWAAYRMGKSQSLFEIVRDLDSSRHDQAAGYLRRLEGPEALYVFLKQDNTPF